MFLARALKSITRKSFSEEFSESFWKLWIILFAHHSHKKLHRCFKIRLRRLSFLICARCTGTITGVYFALYVLANLFQNSYINYLNGVFIALLPLPAVFDWLFQSIRLRESTNPFRFTTGFLLGSSIGLISIEKNFLFVSLTVLCYFSIILISYMKWKWK